MCERARLFLSEAKSIIHDLLKRTLELFDLSLNFVKYYRVNKYLSEREQNRDYLHYSLVKPCKLNFNIISDFNVYLHRLYTSCRLTKSYLRSLHAARMRSSNDYIVIDDEISELNLFLKTKINKLWKKNQSFVSQPEDSIQNTPSSELQDYHQISTTFRQISQFFQILINQLYGVRFVRDSHILQPVVINIIRLLLSITNKLKANISPNKINPNRFNIPQHEEICHVNTKKQSTFKLIEIHPDNPKNDNHSLDDFDEDEFYRLANLDRDD